MERVPAGVVNRRTFENLVLSGAFDWYTELKREDYFEKNNRDETFIEQLLRYGASYQSAEQSKEMSLFGEMDNEMRIQARPIPKSAVPVSEAEKLEKEKELVGMYLSSHPLKPYDMELNYGMLTIKQVHELTPEENMEVCFGGMITKYESKLTQRGKPFGILTSRTSPEASPCASSATNSTRWKNIAVPAPTYSSTPATSYRSRATN